MPALGANLILWINVSDIYWAYECVLCVGLAERGDGESLVVFPQVHLFI